MPGVEPAFTGNLRRMLAPSLGEAGFTFDGRRVFRRGVGDCVQIVDVQVGDRFMRGKFTLNLAVCDPETDTADVAPGSVREYDCDARRRQRLGLLLPSRFPALERLPVVGIVFGRKDTWWSANGTEGMGNAKDALFKYGVTWLEQHTRASSSSASR